MKAQGNFQPAHQDGMLAEYAYFLLYLFPSQLYHIPLHYPLTGYHIPLHSRAQQHYAIATEAVICD